MNQSNVIEIMKSIDNYRIDMYELAMKKGIADPDVIKLSQDLDKKIINIMYIKRNKMWEN
ncbi:MAG: Spo0E family sporulation regulatory protein-aspartic acid phosphatase [Bacillota bacterium]